ncbi:uncharacterized protein [Dysidea avara]|uniref:uncharacterized protein isoform X3 n=1 Tax=Dysidea avara TaxID=196820 RepID=UPI003316642E
MCVERGVEIPIMAMNDPQVLHGLQAIDQVIQKPKLAILSKHYNVLYQSLIPNCKLTIKILRHHFTITDQVEQYILSGDSRRLCCQRVMNVLLVHLDIVKDHHQFCDWFDSVSVMGSLIDKIKTEFSASDKWGHTMSVQSEHQNTTCQHYTQHTNVKISSGLDQLDDSVMDNVIISCTVSCEEALVDKACSCSGRRRLVRQKMLMSTRQPKQFGTETIVWSRKFEHVKSSLNLRCLLNSSEWSIVNTCLPVLYESLPEDYQSTIEKLKTLPQFLGAEQQQKLNSLIPTTLTDVKLINEKIITFIVITLSFSSSSGGMTKLCDIMDELIESTTCVQEVRCDASNSVQVAHPPVSANLISQPEVKLTSTTCHHQVLEACATMPSNVPTYSTTSIIGVSSSDDTAVSSSDMMEDIPGIQLLESHYSDILHCLPMDHHKTLDILQHYFTVDQICQILSSPDHAVANKMILQHLVDHFKATKDLKEFCDRLEKITTILPQPEQLISIVYELRAVTYQGDHSQPVAVLNNVDEADDEEIAVPQILSINEEFSQLKRHYHTIIQLMPDDYEQSIGKLQSHISDDQICIILCSSNFKVANKRILNYFIEKLKCKEDLLDLCDQLEKIATSHDLMVIVRDIRTGVVKSIQFSGSSQNYIPSVNSHALEFALSQSSLDPNSKVVAVLKKNFIGLCRCLPKDHVVSVTRLKQRGLVVGTLQRDLDHLPSTDERNEMILAILIGILQADIQVLRFCDTLEDVVDNETSKKFIHNLRSEVIEALSMNDPPLRNNQSSCLSANNETSDDEYTIFFDRSIAKQMLVINSNSKGLAVVRKNFAKLCHCLPQDYKETIRRIKRTSVVQEGLMVELAMLPTPELANCHILAAMIRPLREELHLVGFCDSLKDLVDSPESKTLIETLRNEVIEAINVDEAHTVICLPSPNSEHSGDLCVSFFDQAIARNLKAIDQNSKVFAVLRKNFTKLCHCLPQDYKQTIRRLKQRAILREEAIPQLEILPTAELVNCHILAGMFVHARMEVHLIMVCDWVKDLVDEDESKAFIDSFKNELIKALTMGDNQSSGRTVLCLPSSNSGNSDDLCISFFDQAIAQHMVSLDPNCKGLAILRRNFAKLCHCLPQDFKQTINRIKRIALVRDGTIYQLSKLPSFELANCHILAAMIRPLSEEVNLIGFCNLVEDLMDEADSKRFIRKLRNELIEAFSDPSDTTVTTTAYTIQPRAMISGATIDFTFLSPDGPQQVSDVVETDVPVVTDTMCTQPTSSDEELLGLSSFYDPLLSTSIAITTTTADTTVTTATVTNSSIAHSNNSFTDHPLTETSDTNTVLTDTTADTS